MRTLSRPPWWPAKPSLRALGCKWQYSNRSCPCQRYHNSLISRRQLLLSSPRCTPRRQPAAAAGALFHGPARCPSLAPPADSPPRSEEHTSELQSRGHLVCRLLLEKKK